MKWSEVAQSCPTLCDPVDYKTTRLLHPWDFIGKNTGVDCHFLLQRKGRGTSKLPTSAASSKKQESSRKTSVSALLTTPKPSTVNKLWTILKEMGIPDHLTCLQISLVAQLVKNLPAMRKTQGSIPGLGRVRLPTPVFWPWEFYGL